MAGLTGKRVGARNRVAELRALVNDTGGGGGLGAEAVQDIVGAMVTGAGGTYNDIAGSITLPTGGGGASDIEAELTAFNTTMGA